MIECVVQIRLMIPMPGFPFTFEGKFFLYPFFVARILFPRGLDPCLSGIPAAHVPPLSLQVGITLRFPSSESAYLTLWLRFEAVRRISSASFERTEFCPLLSCNSCERFIPNESDAASDGDSTSFPALVSARFVTEEFTHFLDLNPVETWCLGAEGLHSSV